MELRNQPLSDLLSQEQVADYVENVRIVEYCPGNGSRYVLVIADLSKFDDNALSILGRSGGRCYAVSWMNGGRGCSMTVGGNNFLHYSYVREKFCTTIVDAVVLAEAIAFLCGLEAVSCDEYLAVEQTKAMA